jgi:hypothetical protein
MPGLVEVYNLGPELRNALRAPGVVIVLSAGWANTELNMLYSGNVQSAWSRREGTDIITGLACLSGQDSGSEGVTGFGAAAGQPLGTDSGVIKLFADALADFTGITVDAKNIQVPDKAVGSRGYSFYGTPSDCLNELARIYGFSWAIIDNCFQAVLDGQPLLGQVTEISSRNGYLIRAEPMLTSAFQIQSGIIIHSLLNPLVNPGTVINLQSDINPALDGSYYSQTVTHNGDTHSNQWETLSETILVNNGY